MTDTICQTCAHCVLDLDGRQRCYSPELHQMGYPGISVTFERDAVPAPDRGSRKCGPDHLNWKARDQ